MTKKILIITDNLPSQINGVVTTYANIEPYAIRDGYTVDYIHPGRFSHVDCPGYNEIKLAYPKNFWKKVEEVNPDHIHVATEGPLGLYARRLFTIHRYHYNTAYHTKFPEAVKKLVGIPESWTWPAIRWFHANSNRVLTTTDSMVSSLKEHGFGNNVVSWTRGVDRDVFKPAPRTSTDKTRLVCVSRVSAEKNLPAFFEMPFPNATKTMVGDGPKLEEYKRLYPGVEFVGAKRGAELAGYFQQADVFVFPSRWDTFGLVMIEAMATGTPVAAYPVQGPVDVVETGVTGFMHVDLNVAVAQCLSLDRETVLAGSQRWSWEAAWHIFRDNLIEVK